MISRIPEVIIYLEEMRKAAKKHIRDLELKEKQTGKNLAKPFEDISNKLEIAFPLTICVLKSPFKSNCTTDIEAIRKQILKTIYRDFLFVATMSNIEYYFAHILLQYPHYQIVQEIQNKGLQKVTLYDLIDWANQEKILTNYDLWDFARSARNDIVHNNAISKFTKKCPINDFTINMVKGQQLTGKLRSILSLTKHIEEEFYDVVNGLN